MKNRIFYLALFTFATLFLNACSSSKESEFNGKWKIESEYFSYDEPTDKGFSDYFVFNDGQYLRTMSDNYQDSWEEDGQVYEVKDEKLIMHTDLGTFKMNTEYSYTFESETHLKLTSADMIDYDGNPYQYIFVLERVGDE